MFSYKNHIPLRSSPKSKMVKNPINPASYLQIKQPMDIIVVLKLQIYNFYNIMKDAYTMHTHIYTYISIQSLKHHALPTIPQPITKKTKTNSLKQ